jgi:hypothetical protein
VAHVGDAGQAKPHLEHNPLSLLGVCNATPMRKLNDPGNLPLALALGMILMLLVLTVNATAMLIQDTARRVYG